MSISFETSSNGVGAWPAPCTCTARLLMLENVPLSFLQGFMAAVNHFGQVQVLNTHVDGDTFRSTVAYSDLRDAQRAYAAMKTWPEFRLASISKVKEADLAVLLPLDNFTSAAQKQQILLGFSQAGTPAVLRMEARPDGGFQVLVFYYDSRCIQEAISLRFAVGTGQASPIVASVEHCRVCSMERTHMTSPATEFADRALLPSFSWKPPVVPWGHGLPSAGQVSAQAPGQDLASFQAQTGFGIASPPVEDYLESRWFSKSKLPQPVLKNELKMPSPPLSTAAVTAIPSIWRELPKQPEVAPIPERPSPPDTSPVLTNAKPVPAGPVAKDKAPQTRYPLRGIVTRDKVPQKNVIDLDLIDQGRENRVTVMLRNIPNKFTQKALKEFLDTTNRNTFDFLYLRMDFENHCNVGYAFISFTSPKHVATLARARCGQRWNMYKSEKLIDLSFAKIQGRNNLITKFCSSPVMKEAAEYRPKLYYTSGPHQGEEEPFPSPRK